MHTTARTQLGCEMPWAALYLLATWPFIVAFEPLPLSSETVGLAASCAGVLTPPAPPDADPVPVAVPLAGPTDPLAAPLAAPPPLLLLLVAAPLMPPLEPGPPLASSRLLGKLSGVLATESKSWCVITYYYLTILHTNLSVEIAKISVEIERTFKLNFSYST